MTGLGAVDPVANALYPAEDVVSSRGAGIEVHFRLVECLYREAKQVIRAGQLRLEHALLRFEVPQFSLCFAVVIQLGEAFGKRLVIAIAQARIGEERSSPRLEPGDRLAGVVGVFHGRGQSGCGVGVVVGAGLEAVETRLGGGVGVTCVEAERRQEGVDLLKLLMPRCVCRIGRRPGRRQLGGRFAQLTQVRCHVRQCQHSRSGRHAHTLGQLGPLCVKLADAVSELLGLLTGAESLGLELQGPVSLGIGVDQLAYLLPDVFRSPGVRGVEARLRKTGLTLVATIHLLHSRQCTLERPERQCAFHDKEGRPGRVYDRQDDSRPEQQGGKYPERLGRRRPGGLVGRPRRQPVVERRQAPLKLHRIARRLVRTEHVEPRPGGGEIGAGGFDFAVKRFDLIQGLDVDGIDGFGIALDVKASQGFIARGRGPGDDVERPGEVSLGFLQRGQVALLLGKALGRHAAVGQVRGGAAGLLVFDGLRGLAEFRFSGVNLVPQVRQRFAFLAPQAVHIRRETLQRGSRAGDLAEKAIQAADDLDLVEFCPGLGRRAGLVVQRRQTVGLAAQRLVGILDLPDQALGGDEGLAGIGGLAFLERCDLRPDGGEVVSAGKGVDDLARTGRVVDLEQVVNRHRVAAGQVRRRQIGRLAGRTVHLPHVAVRFAIDQERIVAVGPRALQRYWFQADEFIAPEQPADGAAGRGFARPVGPHDDVESVGQVVIRRSAVAEARHAVDCQPLDPHRGASFWASIASRAAIPAARRAAAISSSSGKSDS